MPLASTDTCAAVPHNRWPDAFEDISESRPIALHSGSGGAI
jgi:hypothetical protein